MLQFTLKLMYQLHNVYYFHHHLLIYYLFKYYSQIKSISHKCLVANFGIMFAGTENFTGPNSSSSYWSFQQDYSSAGGQQRTATHMLYISGLNLQI